LRCIGPTPARRVGLALLAAASVLALAAAVAPAAAAATPARVPLPSPNTYDIPGTPAALDPGQEITLRVYLAGQHPAGLPAAAEAAATPGGPAYARYLTAAQYARQFGPTATQVAAVTGWLTGQGMTVTATTAHYLAVQATVAEVDRAFDTEVSQYVETTTFDGYTFTLAQVGVVGGFSVPAALGADVATVTGLDENTAPSSTSSAAAASAAPAVRAASASPEGPFSPEGLASRARSASASASASVPAASAPAASRASASAADGTSDTDQCSRYWGQYTETIPAAYGHTTAPTALCGYTPTQLREAYGVTSSGYTGKGTTIAVVLNEAWPTMLADANRFFASQGVAGFAPGQYTENYDSGWASTCGVLQSQPGAQPDPEEALDVESAHIAAPDAKVVLVAADCDPSDQAESPLVVQDLLDATTRVVDRHLADVVTSSWGFQPQYVSPADVAAWNLVYQQGALEGIGFDYSSGDGGSYVDPSIGEPAWVQFPAADPWVTAVGGTTLAIGRDGTALADYPWSDYVTQVDSAGTGYTSPPPGDYQGGSGGGVSPLFTEPGYQRSVVPAALATSDGSTPADRVVPDISANAGASVLIGYTGAITAGVYDQTISGGTSASSPLMAGLEADAMQAAGHAIGFANPALYKLYGTPAISDVGPVNPDDPPVLIGDSIYFGPGDYLDTTGLAEPSLVMTNGYDDTTGIGAPGQSFLTAFSGL
jgi:subtilase family serine protease